MASLILPFDPASSTTFPEFTRLPPELRLKIWKFVFLPRRLRVALGQPLYDQEGKIHFTRGKPRVSEPPPVLLAASKESRNEAQRQYTIIRGVFKRPFYFNASLDTLDMDSMGDPHCCVYFLERLGRRYPHNKVQSLALDDPSFPCVCFAHQIIEYTNLESLMFVGETYPNTDISEESAVYTYQSRGQMGTCSDNGGETSEALASSEQRGGEDGRPSPTNLFLSQRVHRMWVDGFNRRHYSWLKGKKVSVKAVPKGFWKDAGLSLIG